MESRPPSAIHRRSASSSLTDHLHTTYLRTLLHHFQQHPNETILLYITQTTKWTPQTLSSKSKRKLPLPTPSHPTPNTQLTNQRSDVLSTLQSSRPLFSSYLRIRSLAKSPTNPELQQARSELETTLGELGADLDDLIESVRAIEADPYRYGLEIEEVSRRRKLVDDVGAEVEQMRGELKKAVSNIEAGGGGTGELPNPADFETEDGGGEDYYAEMEQQRQMELMHDQDEQLDGVFRTVGNLRQQANDMGRELEEQTGMIGEVDTLADRVGGKLSNGVSRLRHIVRKNEGELLCLSTGFGEVVLMSLDTMSSFCIAALIFVLVLLLILVIVL